MIKEYSSSFPNGTQLSIAIINNNDALFIGFIKQEDSLISVNNKDSVFEIASITKIFTSTLLTHLVVDSIINLDDPIEKFLPFKLHSTNYDNMDIPDHTDPI